MQFLYFIGYGVERLVLPTPSRLADLQFSTKLEEGYTPVRERVTLGLWAGRKSLSVGAANLEIAFKKASRSKQSHSLLDVVPQQLKVVPPLLSSPQ
ncbi:hypothetical protein MHYP_G00027700 [Metynnis hypsauchen]